MVNTFSNEALKHLQVLGVHACALPEEIKQAYDQLANLYSANEETSASINSILQQRFKKIQASYDFIHKNYATIQHEFQHLRDFAKAARNNGLNLAFWSYP